MANPGVLKSPLLGGPFWGYHILVCINVDKNAKMLAWSMVDSVDLVSLSKGRLQGPSRRVFSWNQRMQTTGKYSDAKSVELFRPYDVKPREKFYHNCVLHESDAKRKI